MSRFILEGDSFFVLEYLKKITENKKVVYQPDDLNLGVSFFKRPDYYVFFDINKDIADKILNVPFIVCALDKNFDLRTDWVKELKREATYKCFEPIPSTDFQSLNYVFPKIKFSHFLPVKKTPLKYKNAKQNYEWYDLSLIADMMPFQKEGIFEELCESYFDIWRFTDALWSGDMEALNHIKHINNTNFEEYFNRIRETIKDYIEVYQSNSSSFHTHTTLIKNPVVNHSFRFDKIKEKLNSINPSKIIDVLFLYDECLKNVRAGSNPKLELTSLFFKYHYYVTR